MLKKNQWKHGEFNFVFPGLGTSKGQWGCKLWGLTLDKSVGQEICAVFMEEPEYVKQFEAVSPFNLIVHTGLVRSPDGIVGFIIWQIAANSPQEVLVEQYVNPFEIGTIRLVASAANQTNFKLLVINRETAEVAALVDYPNVFKFDEFVSAMALGLGHEPDGRFAEASQYVMNNYSVAALVALADEQKLKPAVHE